ncbi:coiled-coil domain-containing protein SCD2-like [Henckelia pumila]|uniref:coiled-coil domain-containing protein SCD2-like n=1 Tax=Henckelia pumila TaxID=405737 RepID=UPI003C6DD874
MTSPLHRHVRSGSAGVANMRRPQNTKVAAQRLAQVMAHQPADDEDDEDDLYDFESAVPSVGIGLAGGKKTRNRSPTTGRTTVVQPPSARLTFVPRPSATVGSVEEQPLSAHSASLLRPSNSKPVDPITRHFPQPKEDYAEELNAPSARSTVVRRSPSYISLDDQPPSARFESPGGRNVAVKTVSMVPPSIPISHKPVVSGILAETQQNRIKDKRLSLDFGTFKYKESSDQQSAALKDELDVLQEENDNLLEKLRIAEKRCEESEVRTMQLEQQIESLGGGISLEARLLSRKEADLQKREAALKVSAQIYGGSDEEIAALRMEAENARNEATSALEQLNSAESEVKSLRIMAQRMILTQEEMEEVVLKRCWLARYWSLCLRHGIYSEIAGARYKYWSSVASRPVEMILAAGQKATDENASINNDLEEREKVLLHLDDISTKADVESMLLVDKGLRELNTLKVEEAVTILMAQNRRPSIAKSDSTDEINLPIEGQNFTETFELSEEEYEDVLLKQAWLTYFWRRAKNHGLEPDIAEERLQFWINQDNVTPDSHDAVDVERGLMELRKLGIETKLWEESRRIIDPDSTKKTLLGIDS